MKEQLNEIWWLASEIGQTVMMPFAEEKKIELFCKRIKELVKDCEKELDN